MRFAVNKIIKMKNSAYTEESGQAAVEVNQRQDISFQQPVQPPPYSSIPNFGQTSVPHFGPTSIPHFAPSNAYALNIPNPNSALNLFNETLNNMETFILAPMGRFGFATRTIIVQLQNAAQQPIMSIMTVPGQNVSNGHHNHHSVRVGSVIQMTNTSGQVLLTAKEVGQSMTVSSGDQVLGVVEGNMLCGSTLSARGIMGEMLFYSIGGTETSPSSPGGCCGSTPSKFTLISNGVALARIEKSPNGYGGYSITLFNSRNMDSRTKALLIFTGYLMYYAFLADTTFGSIGARGLVKRLFMFFCIFFFVVLILFILVPVIVMTT